MHAYTIPSERGQLEYLYLICELAAAFAGFTAIISIFYAEPEARVGEYALNKMRLRQMLENSLFTIAAGLLPALIMGMGLAETDAFRAAGMVGAPAVLLLMVVQVRRGFAQSVRQLPGYSVGFARFAFFLGVLLAGSFVMAAAGVARPAAWYMIATTLGLVIAALQFLRTSTTVLRFGPARIPDNTSSTQRDQS